MHTTRRERVLAERLRELRVANGIDQGTVAEHLGLNSRAQVSNLERGVRRVQALELIDLCRLYGVSLAKLVRDL